MTFHPLTEEEAAYSSGCTHRGIITAADLAALTGGTGAQTINLAAVVANAGMAVDLVRIASAFAFSDATLTSCAVTVGDSGSGNRFVTSYEILSTPATMKGGVALNPLYNVYAAADNLQVTFTPTGGKNLNTCTAGELHILCKVRNTGVA